MIIRALPVEEKSTAGHYCSALLNTNRFRFTFFDRSWFEGFRRDFKKVAASVGVDFNEYQQWLTDHGLTDNISSRHRHMTEKFPPTKN